MADVLAVREEYRLQEWAQIYRRCKESGLSNLRFCVKRMTKSCSASKSFWNILLSSYPLSMTKVAFLQRVMPRSIAANVISLDDVKFFSAEEWISEKMLTGCLDAVKAQASVT